MADLNQKWTAASEELYKATQGAQQAPDGQPGENQGGQGGDQAGGEQVTDVPYEEVK
jgi:molecular chaperone DnaK